jgi:hypothetical protein
MRQYLSLLFILTIVSAQAQLTPVLKNKRGIAILPQQGEYSIGFGVNPVFTYFGNFFNGSNSNNFPATGYAAPNQMLALKYMKTNDKAYRANFRIAYNNDVLSFNVKDMSPGADVNAVVTDKQKRSSSFIGLGLGVERRKGQGRIQGIYGLEGLISYASGSSIKYEYGNKLENLDTGIIRVKKQKASSLFSVGFRAFAGVEYFIAPKLSLGAEFGYGPSIGFRGTSEQTMEQHDFAKAETLETVNSLSPKSTNFTLDTDNYNGILKMLFYF